MVGDDRRPLITDRLAGLVSLAPGPLDGHSRRLRSMGSLSQGTCRFALVLQGNELSGSAAQRHPQTVSMLTRDEKRPTLLLDRKPVPPISQ